MTKMPTHGRVAGADGAPTPAWLSFFNDLATTVQFAEAEDIDTINAVLDEQEDELAGLQEVFDDVDEIYSRLIFANVVTCKAYWVNMEADTDITITHNFFNERAENVIRQNQQYVYDDDGDGNAAYGNRHYHFFGWKTEDYATVYTASTMSNPPDETIKLNFHMQPELFVSDGNADSVLGENDHTLDIGGDSFGNFRGEHIIAYFLPWFRGYDAD